MSNYAHVQGEDVVNVIVLDDDADPAEFVDAIGGGQLIPLDDHEGGAWGVGWRYVNGAPVPPPVRELSIDRQTIPADGTTAALVTYRDTHDDAPASVTFTVNGVDQAVDVTDGVAELEVTGTVPGRIEVTVDALPDQRVITVEEA